MLPSQQALRGCYFAISGDESRCYGIVPLGTVLYARCPIQLRLCLYQMCRFGIQKRSKRSKRSVPGSSKVAQGSVVGAHLHSLYSGRV